MNMTVKTHKCLGSGALRIFAAMALLVLALTGCQQKGEFTPPPPPMVTVATPTTQDVTEYAEFSGTTEAFEFVEVRARVEGYIESMDFQPGSVVQRGDLLFNLDRKPFQARLDEAVAALERRRAELKQAEATLQRREMAFRAKAVSELDVIQSRADRDVAQAAIEGARAAVDTARINLSYTRIHAPTTGRIGRALVDLGNLVGTSERSLLTTILRDDPIYAYFNINERDFIYYQSRRTDAHGPTNGDGRARLELGTAGDDGYPFEGTIDFVDNRLDPSTGTIQVRGVFPNPERKLLPGLFVRIRVPLGVRENAVVVPDVALGTDQRGRFLLTVDAENVVQYRPVTAGALVGGLREIREGISIEDRVIVAGVQSARPGLKVTVRDAGAQQSPDAAGGKAQ